MGDHPKPQEAETEPAPAAGAEAEPDEESSRPASRLVGSLGTVEGLGAVWDGFRAGGVAHCPRDTSPLALAVDAAAASYRFVCVRCGVASPWFESGAAGLRLRTPPTTLAPGSLGDD
jgi:hypothetical protein